MLGPAEQKVSSKMVRMDSCTSKEASMIFRKSSLLDSAILTSPSASINQPHVDSNRRFGIDWIADV
jgi:hypothetical protein